MERTVHAWIRDRGGNDLKITSHSYRSIPIKVFQSIQDARMEATWPSAGRHRGSWLVLERGEQR